MYGNSEMAGMRLTAAGQQSQVIVLQAHSLGPFVGRGCFRVQYG